MKNKLIQRIIEKCLKSKLDGIPSINANSSLSISGQDSPQEDNDSKTLSNQDIDQFQNPNSLCIWTEKVESKGEDAPPIMIIRENEGFLGVFDGLGGAGGFSHSDKNGNSYTEAYLASRAVRNSLEEYINNHSSWNMEDLSLEIRVVCQQALDRLSMQIPPISSSFKSKMIKRLPSTISMIVYRENDDSNGESNLENSSNQKSLEEDHYKVTSIWAGDSRCFALNPSGGLLQLSKDDLENGCDPLENITIDAQMSNCVFAEGDFFLNQRTDLFEAPLMLLTVTDGCFHYLETPMHFEELLLRTLISSESIDEWKDQLSYEIKKVTSDDASLALITIGYRNFDELKDSFKLRHKYILTNFTTSIDSYRNQLTLLEEERKNIEKIYRETIQSSWNTYKTKYYSLYLGK